MPRDKQPRQEPDILDNLFGNLAEFADDELDMLFTALAPSADPRAAIRNIAEATAVKYRTQNKTLPEYVQAAIDTTCEVTRPRK